MKYTTLITLLFATVTLSGCFDIELEVPVLTQVATVEGNAVLNKANAKLHGEVLAPSRIENGFGLGDQAIGQVYLQDFVLRVTDDARADLYDIDDLLFVESIVLYVRPLDEHSALKEVAVAWYYQDESMDSTPSELVFEVDPEMDLKAYVDAGFELYSKSVSRVPADDVSVEGLATFIAVPE
jgi:hypothetical protein